jgi:hypothetical protein
MHKRIAVMLGTALLAWSPAASAQVMWDTPSFLGPRPADDIGVYAFRPEQVGGAGGDWGFLAIWRQSGNINLGVRAGIGGQSGAREVLVGAELIQPLALFGPASPLELAGTLGIGATLNSVTALRVPVGITAGFTIPLGTMVLTPFVHPRLAFDLFAFDVDGQEETETEFNVPVDLGAELQIGESIILRFGAALDDRTVLGLGAALRIPRRVVVR